MSSAFWWPVTHTPVLTGKGKLVVLLSCCFHVEGVGDTVGGGIRWVGRYWREILETSKPKLYFCQLRSLVFFSVFKRVRERNHFFSKLHKILYQNFHKDTEQLQTSRIRAFEKLYCGTKSVKWPFWIRKYWSLTKSSLLKVQIFIGQIPATGDGKRGKENSRERHPLRGRLGGQHFFKPFPYKCIFKAISGVI